MICQLKFYQKDRQIKPVNYSLENCLSKSKLKTRVDMIMEINQTIIVMDIVTENMVINIREKNIHMTVNQRKITALCFTVSLHV